MSKITSAMGSTVTLRQATYGFVFVGMLISIVGVFAFARVQRAEYQNAAKDLAVRVRLQGAAADLSRSLADDWDRLAEISREAATLEGVKTGMRGAFASDRMVGWAGIVGDDGIVPMGLDGSKMAILQRSWLTAARNEPFVGVVHDDAQESYLIMAQPFLIGANGGTAVVLMPFDKLSDYLMSSATALGMDLFLIDPNSTRIAASGDVQWDRFDIPSLRTASAGIASSQRETWPDGTTYFSSVVLLAQVGNLPPTGLRMIGRIDPGEFAAADRTLLRESAQLITALSIAIGLLTLLFVKVFIAPFGKLAENADRIANGVDEYPYEGKQTREMALLSAAFSRINESRGKNRLS